MKELNKKRKNKTRRHKRKSGYKKEQRSKTREAYKEGQKSERTLEGKELTEVYSKTTVL